jgi:hypothetical protein
MSIVYNVIQRYTSIAAVVAASVQSVLAAINPGLELEIRRSHLIDSGRWKRAGDRVTERKMSRVFKVKRKLKAKPVRTSPN